ncbi:MAG: aldo/keto reductase [Burkholderiales bacterium]|nr:aldo/keto reductase [Burkholderiales bacterium]MDE2455954.1 aldo/keto reductase [Burkholderiales bacterium]
METTEIAPGVTIPRIIRGGWQLADDHGEVDRARALDDIAAFVERGLDTVDGADIYTGVELLYGEFNARRRAAGQPGLRVHTKFVPDRSALGRVDAAYVRGIVTRSLQRLQLERLALVQFHWWDYEVPGAVEAAGHLEQLRREGLIDQLGGTNFDTPHARALLDAGIGLVSMQVQYSLLDRRPAHALAALGRERGMQLLCYGTLAGGFISERWLGVAEPAPGTLANRSLVKYKLVIDEFGGWAAFQKLLNALHTIATRHAVSLSTVAVRWVLDQPAVAAAIVGARYADRIDDTLQVFGLRLDGADHALLAPLLAAAPGPAGDTYALERDRNGPHGRIMKYDLNQSPPQAPGGPLP